MDRHNVGRLDRVCGALRRADVRGHRVLPPLLLAPHVQDQPVVPVRDGVCRPVEFAKGCVVVGGASPQPSQVLRPALGCTLTDPKRLLVLPRAVVGRPRHQRDRLQPDPRPRQVPGVGPAQQVLGDPPGGFGGHGVAVVWLVGPVYRVFPEHRVVVARHLPRQLVGPCLGHAAVCHRRHQPQQLVDRPRHLGRRLAQQPSPLHGLDPPRVLLVGDRPVLLRAEVAELVWPDLGLAASA